MQCLITILYSMPVTGIYVIIHSCNPYSATNAIDVRKWKVILASGDEIIGVSTDELINELRIALNNLCYKYCIKCIVVFIA